MNLQEHIRKVLREELSARIRRRIPPDEMEKEFLESFESAYDLTKKRKISFRFFKEKLIYSTISMMMDGLHWRFLSTLPENEFWYDEIFKDLKEYYEERIIQMYNEREGINESVLREENQKMNLFLRRRINLEQFEKQLNKGRVHIYYDSKSLKDYKWKLVTSTLENYIYYQYDIEIDGSNSEVFETINYLVNIFDDKLTDMYESLNNEFRPKY